jgi:hypothetical protein
LFAKTLGDALGSLYLQAVFTEILGHNPEMRSNKRKGRKILPEVQQYS